MKYDREFMLIYIGCIIYTAIVLLVGGTSAFCSFIGISIALLLFTKNVSVLFYFYFFINFNVHLSNIRYGMMRVSYIINLFMVLYVIVLLIYDKKEVYKYKNNIVFLFTWWLYCILVTFYMGISQVDAALMSMTANVSLCAVVLILSSKVEKKLIRIVTFSYEVMLLVGYIELLTGHTFLYSKWTLEERYRFGIIRVGSTMADPNLLCSIIVPMFFVLQIEKFRTLNGWKRTKILRGLSLLLTVTTFSRAGIAAFVLGLIIVYVCNNFKKAIVAVPVMLCGVLLGKDYIFAILSYEGESLSARTIIVNTAIKEWQINPIIGHGWDWFSKNSEFIMGKQWDTMNTYVYVLVNLGIIGLLFLLWYYYKISKEVIFCFIKSKTNKKSDEIFLLAMIISWLVITYTLDEFNVAFMWIMPMFFAWRKRSLVEGISNVKFIE